jgi:hypothetical protein
MNPNAGKYFPKDGERHPNVVEHERIAQMLVETGYLKWETNTDGEYELCLPRQVPKSTKKLPAKVSLSVEWGYELHSVSIRIRDWAAILGGDERSLKSKGWYEGKSFPVWWSFNHGEHHSLYVSYGKEGSTGFEGDITDGYISEER